MIGDACYLVYEDLVFQVNYCSDIRHLEEMECDKGMQIFSESAQVCK
jgi:hypothetical protein